jgi:hypothetical protein
MIDDSGWELFLLQSPCRVCERIIPSVFPVPKGFEFGGTCWDLFRIFPECSGGSPEYEGEISASGYKTFRFSVQQIFDLAHAVNNTGSTSILLGNGEKVGMPIYQMSFVLKK